MAFPSLAVNIQLGNLARQAPDTDNVACLVVNDLTNVAALPDKTKVILYSEKQAVGLGLTAAYDIAQKTLVHHHVSEFFRMNPSGELHLIALNEGATTYSQSQILGTGTTPGILDPFMIEANGRIKQIALLDWNVDYTDLITGASVELAQAFVDRLSAKHIWIDVVYLEGYGFEEVVGAAQDLRTYDCRNVGVVVGGDATIAQAQAEYNGYAALGTLLGSSTNKQVHESLAWAKDTNTITSVADSRFLGVKIHKDFTTDPDPYINDIAAQTELHNKGYIFPRQYPLRSGYYWSQSNNCVEVDNDINSIELVQVINKAIRFISDVLSSKINQTFDVVDGRLTEVERRVIVAEILATLELNLINNISSIGDIEVDPTVDTNNQAYSSILADSTLRARVGIVPKGKAEQIVLEIGFQA